MVLWWSKMNTDLNRLLISNLSIFFSIFFRHKRQSWWSPLHAQVGICPIGEADFCTTKRRHLPLHELRGDQRSKGCIIPMNCLLTSSIHHDFFCTRNHDYFELGFPAMQCMLRRVCVKKTQNVNKWTMYWTNENLDFSCNFINIVKMKGHPCELPSVWHLPFIMIFFSLGATLTILN